MSDRNKTKTKIVNAGNRRAKGKIFVGIVCLFLFFKRGELYIDSDSDSNIPSVLKERLFLFFKWGELYIDSDSDSNIPSVLKDRLFLFFKWGEYIDSDSNSDSNIPSVLKERPGLDVIHGWYKTERQCRKYAKEIRRFRSENWMELETWMHTKYPDSCYATSPDFSPCIPMVHTELLLQRPKGNVNDFNQKEQLPILSFLASQPLTEGPTLKLNIIVNELDYENPPTWLLFLLNHETYGKRIQLTNFKFDVVEDLSRHQKDLLVTAFNIKTDTIQQLAYKSDLRRYAVLYHYGGLWFDTDTIFVNDVRPLLNYDFVYVANSRYNGAVMGVNGTKSDFMRKALDHATTTLQENRYKSSYYKFAHDLFRDLTEQTPELFLKLSGCLFESGWGGDVQNAQKQMSDVWDLRLNKRQQMDFLVNDREGVFSFHWQGYWGYEIQPGSLGSRVRDHYIRHLKLDPAVFES